MFLITLTISLCFILSIKSQIYTGVVTNLLGDNSITITIDYNLDIVELTLNGTITTWNGFGFGNTGMSGTYAIITEYDPLDVSQGIVHEFTLQNFNAGTQYSTPEITVISDEIIISPTRRCVKVTRSISGIYTFPNPPINSLTPFEIDVITAIGPQPSNFITSPGHRTNRASGHCSFIVFLLFCIILNIFINKNYG